MRPCPRAQIPPPMRKALGTLIQGLEFLEYRLVSASYSASVNDMTPPPFVLKLRTVLPLSCTVLSQFMHGAGKVLHCVFQKTDNHYSSFIKQRFFYRERVCYNNFSTVIMPFYDLFFRHLCCGTAAVYGRNRRFVV